MSNDLLTQVRAKLDYAEGRDSWGLTVYNADLVAPIVEALIECAAALREIRPVGDKETALVFNDRVLAAADKALRKLAEVSK